MNSLNIHDPNDMQSHKLGEAMFDEYDIFCPPSFDEQIYYDESMPPIYDDYIEESGFGRVSTLFSDDSTISEEVPIDYENKVAIHDATENYYEGGIHACRSCNNIKFPLYVLKVVKLYLFCLPMLVDSCSHKLCAHKIPRHRKWVRFKCASHILQDALLVLQFLPFM